MRLPIIGITGNTGSGKSLASAMLKERGAYIIDADKLSRDAIAYGTDGYRQVVDIFGTSILNDPQNASHTNAAEKADHNAAAAPDINRKKLGAIVFADRQKLKQLETIVHKYVVQETNTMIKMLQANPGPYRFIVVDAPLLIEAGMHKQTDMVVVVYADEKIRLNRIITRDGITEEAAKARMKNQRSLDSLRPYADVLIENNGDTAQMANEIEKLTRMWSSCSS